jgi:cyclophilin family peptidyl-prolyl cis-trans isomerase
MRAGGIRWQATRRAAARASAKSACALALGLALFAGCGEDAPAPDGGAEAVVPVPEATGPRDVAVLEVQDLGAIRVELLPELAPQTVAHFRRLVEEGYYDGTTFHRVVPDFVIQGGDPNSRDRDPRNDGRGGRQEEIAIEASDVTFVRGVVAMANRRGASTSGPQFFVTVEDRPDLDGRFALFGHVVEGMDVVDAIARVPTDTYGRYGPKDRPLEDVVMTIRIEEGAGGTAAGAAAPGDTAEAAAGGPDAGAGEASAEDEGDFGGGEWREGAP